MDACFGDQRGQRNQRRAVVTSKMDSGLRVGLASGSSVINDDGLLRPAGSEIRIDVSQARLMVAEWAAIDGSGGAAPACCDVETMASRYPGRVRTDRGCALRFHGQNAIPVE
uniref:Uncharacterized protein n=1 Tax=Arundo donax TaxID=35708 RepID=A0A0A8XNZ7_ARUDO